MSEQEQEVNNEEEDLGPEPAPYDNANSWKEPIKKEKQKPDEMANPSLDSLNPSSLEDRGK